MNIHIWLYGIDQPLKRTLNSLYVLEAILTDIGRERIERLMITDLEPSALQLSIKEAEKQLQNPLKQN